MTETGVLCVDIGTSSLKSGLVFPSGSVDAVDRFPVSLKACRLNPNVWIDALEALVRRIPHPERVAAIAVSGNGPTIVPVRDDGTPSGPANIWLDNLDERIVGQPSYFLSKILWYRRNRPEVDSRTRWFLSCPEFIDYYLTGFAVTIVPSPEFAPYYWTPEGASAYGVSEERLPAIVSPTDAIGEGLLPERAATWGMRAGIPVFAAGPDFLMSLLGTGTTSPGRTCDRAGTSEGINYCSRDIISDAQVRTLPHVVSGYYNVAGILSSTGRLFEWLREITGQTDRSYVTMLQEIRDAEDTSLPAFFPSIHAGARWEFSRGVFVGLGAEHGPAQIGRAVVEAIGYSVRERVEILESIVGPLDELRICGGQAKNHVWNQMKADITGKVLAVPEVLDAELIGNAGVAYAGMGEFASIQSAADALVHIRKRVHPDMRRHSAYSERYRRYLEAQSRIREPLADCAHLLGS